MKGLWLSLILALCHVEVARLQRIVHYPIGNVNAIVASNTETSNRFSKFWSRLEKGSWELSTLKIFHQVIDKTTSVIDFGTWIGPTIFFSGNFAKVVVGFEPNPEAYKLVKRGLDLNHEKGHLRNVQVHHNCISATKEHVRMRHGPESAADSMGSVVSLADAESDSPTTAKSSKKSKKKLHPTLVPCDTLESMLGRFFPSLGQTASSLSAGNSSAKSEHLFIKVDVEGYESNIIGTWKGWVPLYQPTIFLSMHQQAHFAELWNDTKRNTVKETLRLFPFVYEVEDVGQKVHSSVGRIIKHSHPLNEDFTLCRNCDYLLSHRNLDAVKL